MEFTVDGVIINTDLDVSVDEARNYIQYVDNHANFNRDTHFIWRIDIKLCDDGKIDVDYYLKDKRKFERIRRITGYLTGDLNTWNDAKRAEERERVKHSTDNYQDFFTYSGRTIPYEK